MTYHVGQMVQLTTSLTGTGTAPAMALVVTKPDGTTTTPTVSAPTVTATGWTWTANVLADQANDWLYQFTASGSYVGVDAGQFHVIAAGLRVVGLDEVKEHGNITSTASDRELLDFIGTAQQMVEQLVGPTVPVTVTGERHRSVGSTIWLDRPPVLSITSVQEYAGATPLSALVAGEWAFDAASGRLDRIVSGYPSYWLGTEVLVTYRAGRAPIPEAIRWGAKELTVHLWRSTQAQRGGRARGDVAEAATAAPFGVPNRVRDALALYLLPPGVA